MRKIILLITIVFAAFLCVAAYIEAQHLTPYEVQNTSKSRYRAYSQFQGYSLKSNSLLAYTTFQKGKNNRYLYGTKDSVVDCTRNGVGCVDKRICGKCGKAYCAVQDTKKYPNCKGLKRAVNGVCPYCGAPMSESCGTDTCCRNNGKCIQCDTICNCDNLQHRHHRSY